MARFSASSSERLGRLPLPPAGPRVYLDYAGFSPVDPRVVALMRPFLEGGVGNPNAEGFYRSCGFAKLGTKATRFGVGLLMKRSVE